MVPQTISYKVANLIVEITTKSWKYYISLVDKAKLGFERLTSILNDGLLWVKSYQIALLPLPTTEI